MKNEYNVHIADACYYIAAHALPDGHRVVTYYLYARESFNLGE